jgi:hypothetical protein
MFMVMFLYNRGLSSCPSYKNQVLRALVASLTTRLLPAETRLSTWSAVSEFLSVRHLDD